MQNPSTLLESIACTCMLVFVKLIDHLTGNVETSVYLFIYKKQRSYCDRMTITKVQYKYCVIFYDDNGILELKDCASLRDKGHRPISAHLATIT